ncbi:MAG: hypothetical protein IKT86_01650 [Bacteroidaceae bacterium]|nr:hypothetical protein [Bacteroidaceae bacterium]
MKKEYIKPEIVVEEFILPEAIVASSYDYKENMGSNETPGGVDDFNTNKRRGTWGDLWTDL